ncbi:MAG: Ldh family oxidoreductase [Nitrososphaerota archaeon]|nr:Ldh family oxidoreductase [Nitrososphaerota archaeon]
MPIFPAKYLIDVGIRVFEAAGVPEDESKLIADLLVRANMVGQDSHGVIRIIQYVDAIQKGKVKPGAQIEVVRETPSTALINGNWGFGQVVAKKSMEIAIQKAKENGISTVCAFNLYHIGRLADYTEMASKYNMIGVAMVNSTRMVAPHGGRERVLSTAPLSYAFPTGSGMPLILDMSTSACAEGKIRIALHKGEKLPLGYIIDGEGNLSTNPEDLYRGGAILPMGGEIAGHKGFGLAIVVEILAGILSGAGCAYENEKFGNGVFFQAINISNFMQPEEFKRRVDGLIKAVKSSKLRPGYSEILIPGELEYRMLEKRSKEGIYVPERTWKEIQAIAERVGINLLD